MRKYLLTTLSIIMGFLLFSKGVYAQDKLTIVTSFYPIYSMTAEIVGDKHEVFMINSGKGIHGFEPSANDIAAIYDADIFIYHSSILESWTKNLEANKDNSQVTLLEAGKDLDLLQVKGTENIEGVNRANLKDPHSWLDPLLFAQEASRVAESLQAIDPENAEYYFKNAKQIETRANKIIEVYQQKFNKKSKKVFLTQHSAFYYLAKRFGLEQLSIAGISSDIEPSAKKLNEIIKFVSDNQLETIFVEPNINDRIAKMIAESTGVNILMLSPLESDPGNEHSFLDNYEEQLTILVENIE